MTNSATLLLIELIRVGLLHGPTALIRVIQAFKTDNPTPEEIRTLMVEKPETWFED